MLTEIAAGVFLETEYEGGNVGYIRTELGGLLVDVPPLPHQARDWQTRAMALQPMPLYGLVNTDCHLERILGNGAVVGLRTFGHESATRLITKYTPALLEQFVGHLRDLPPGIASEIEQTVLRPPEISVQDRLVLFAPDREVHILHLEGHTAGSLGVYLPAERLLFAGDCITVNEPPALVQANSQAWLDTLDRIREMDVGTIVPASGPVCGQEVIAPLYAYIADMRRLVQEMFDAGASRRECVEKIEMADYYPLPKGQEARLKRRRRESIERVYTEIRLSQRRRRA